MKAGVAFGKSINYDRFKPSFDIDVLKKTRVREPMFIVLFVECFSSFAKEAISAFTASTDSISMWP